MNRPLLFAAIFALGSALTASAQPAAPAPAKPGTQASRPARVAASKPAAKPRVSTVPLPELPYPPARPFAKDVFAFAAEHPEVLSYVPCFCGCERSGHKDNDDCFVASRDAKGNVTGWEMHGYT